MAACCRCSAWAGWRRCWAIGRKSATTRCNRGSQPTTSASTPSRAQRLTSARISAARIHLRGARPWNGSTRSCSASRWNTYSSPTLPGWTLPCVNTTCETTRAFSRTRQRRDKSQAKRNPEEWGDTSGLNVAYKDQYNKAQTPEHNVCSCCYEI
ncbi:hypothetical protein EMIT0357P_110077 [Pseudomonas marginalis]